jgi:exodeoxyribonuclease V alpha subunit
MKKHVTPCVGDLVKYIDDFYTIDEIFKKKNQLLPNYKISAYIKPKKEEDGEHIIEYDNKNVKFIIDKKLQQNIKSYLKFRDNYNSIISYVNKKKNINLFFLTIKNVERDVESFFDECGLTINQLKKIGHVFKKTLNSDLYIYNIIINPFYYITETYQLITFNKAEYICLIFKLNIDFEMKCNAWVYDFFIKKNNSFYVPVWKFEKEFKKYCENMKKNVKQYLNYTNIHITIQKNISGKLYKTTNFLLKMEKEITDRTLELFYEQAYDIDKEEINELINKYEIKRNKEKSDGFKLEKEQRKSVIDTILNKLSIITGPPGSGKSEIVKCINFVFEKLNKNNDSDNKIGYVNPDNISLLAPTGLAYINLKKGMESKLYNQNISGTCHRFLYHTYHNILAHKYDCSCLDKNACEYNDLRIDLCIIDETSMIDIFIFNDILKMCEYFQCRLILLGDINQLPSIGPGLVLKHLINSECFNVTVLNKIKRQAEGTLVNCIIKMNANVIITPKDFIDNDITFINIDNFDDNLEKNILELKEKFNLDRRMSKCLTYFNKQTYTFNVNKINNILQNIYNPKINENDENYENDEIKSVSFYPYTFRIEDLIIRIENDYSNENMRANGEHAVIRSFDGKKVTIEYLTDNKTEILEINELYDNFLLNYCTTIHKSQGSQFDTVLLFIEPNQNIIDKTAIYTAISRSNKRCIIISNENDFIKSQKNNTNVDNKKSLFMVESDEFEL